ncbi:DNA-formamidopyrimidine glycosylase [Myxococcus stipitatus]|uniref:DNA-formamidopyrimidine glycosylase n=1 Tax=Myxococcus stipitatus TaxID=83455 RepID=UPI001EED9A52|nr:DNA-formamidopyrimidine glycosylase [Myxococcus stipitatus]MCE9668154.1 DNA-formamidopyrimidine glycosylase [Myxococcus stipitatus]
MDTAMAEVPEVETYAGDLRRAVVGRRILDAAVLAPQAVRFPAPDAFLETVRGRRVLSARRRAKFLLLELEAGQTLAVHLMLHGGLTLKPEGAGMPPDVLVALTLEGGEVLLLTDGLGYARVALAPGPELSARLQLDALGPEALDAGFTPEVLAHRLRRRKGPLKTVLLNQRALAGLGNRDADESLWLAGLDPRRSASSLSTEELTRLHHAILSVLGEGLALRGTQRDLFGARGRARHRRNVFGRTGEPCPRCGSRVTRTRIGGRNTFWCPTCQPEQGASPGPFQLPLP